MVDRGAVTRERILTAAEPLILKRGFAGTSLDDILKAAGVTKGAFFHHFQSKGDLARALIERVANVDLLAFEQFLREAESESDDPLQQTYLFLEKFERVMSDLAEPPSGCMFAIYTYESQHLDSTINAFVADSFRRWTELYERKFRAVLARYTPARRVGARELAEMIVTVIEGSFVLARAYHDAHLMARQARQFRQYLQLLFADAAPQAAASAGQRKAHSIPA